MKERLWIYSGHSKTAEKECLSRVAFSLCGVGFCFRRFPALDLRFLQHLRDRVHSTGLGKCGSVRILRHDVIRWAQVWVARLKSERWVLGMMHSIGFPWTARIHPDRAAEL